MTDNSTILNRLKKNLKARKSLVKTGLTSAYRLYEKDIPEYPYIIDIYNDFAVIYEKGKKLNENDEVQKAKHLEHLNLIKNALTEVLKINNSQIIVKQRVKQSGKNQYEQLSKQNNFIEVNEFDFKFRVNLFDYLDTGLFLDHRPLRQKVSIEAKDKKVLNLFSYTGSISVAAAVGGGFVTTVDMSKTYIDWAKENFKINNLSIADHKFVQADVLQFIESNQIENFDIIILDPPSFSNSKRMEEVFNVQDAHVKLIETLMNKLNTNGVLYFSNNFRNFKMDEKLQEKFKIKDITRSSIPIDFRDPKIHVCFEIRHKT